MTQPRLLFIAQPPATVLNRLRQVLVDERLDVKLGSSMFDPMNWHQSLSDRYPFTVENVEALKRVGSRVRAPRFSMILNRLTGTGNERMGFQWAFRTRGHPAGLKTLVECLSRELTEEGMPSPVGHTGHLTISYQAPSAIDTIRIEPLTWTIEDLLLVQGHGKPYRYEIMARWQLPPPAQPEVNQPDLFGHDTDARNRDELASARKPIVEMLCSRIVPEVLAIYAFGSGPREMDGPDSDLDFAVAAAGVVEPQRLWDVAQSLSDLVHRPVDLVDLRAASTVMQHQIITTGQRWWAKDAQASLYESMILSEKTWLDEARAGTLADILERGSIYGR